MEIKILGTGCPNCKRLEKLTHEAVEALGIEAHISHVTDMQAIMAYDILATPGLVVDEKVLSSGRVPSKAEITTLLTTALS